MAFQSRSERSKAVPTDERAQQVNAIGGVNLPLDGRPDGRLAASVHQQIGGGQRNQWLGGGSGERSASGERPNLTQNSQGNDERIARLNRGRALLVPQPRQKRVADFCLPCEPLVLRHGMQGALEKTTQVVGNRDVRVGRLWRADIGSTGLKRRNEPLKLDCEKLLVQPGNQFGHRAHGRIGATAEIPAASDGVMLK